MDPTYTIGNLARAAGVPVSTVRFYERNRLLRPDARTQGNYRVYGPATLERLRFIRAALASGFTLRDIGALLNLRGGTRPPNKKVQALIEDRLADLDERAEELRRVRSVLRAFLTDCRDGGRSGRCKVIEGLDAAHATRRRARR